MQPVKTAKQQTRTITIPKETKDYRLVSDNPDNWYLVANRNISKGEMIDSVETSFHINVGDGESVDVILEPTGEQKRIYTHISAVPGDGSCVLTMLELPWCFANHSCEPNVQDIWSTNTRAELKYVDSTAKQDIAKGEALTYDYALEYYHYEPNTKCQCGAPSCRGALFGFKQLNPEQQKQLLPFASPFVQERYRRESVFEQVGRCPPGRHLLIDYWDCDAALLNDEAKLRTCLANAADAAGATVMSTHSHCFEHLGVTVVAILAESHISIHTWPEAGYAGVDVYTCGICEPMLAHDALAKALCSRRVEVLEVARGRTDSSSSISTVSDDVSRQTERADDKDWFLENTVPGSRYGNVTHSFHIAEVIHKAQTQFQNCLIFENPVYERVLVLDGIVQLSTSDEHIYHDMLIHPPMFTHPKPRRVVIVGGGDGGALREVLKHNPDQVVMIDIDEQFVRIAEKYLANISLGAFDDPRVTLLFEDASEALLRYENYFDVAIIDCNDAVGPSEVLFEADFYATVARALKNDGVCAVQAGSMLDTDFLIQTRQRMASHLGQTTGFRLTMPSYHCGEYVFLMSSKTSDPTGPGTETLTERQAERGIVTKYWSPQMHQASQVLPPESSLW